MTHLIPSKARKQRNSSAEVRDYRPLARGPQAKNPGNPPIYFIKYHIPDPLFSLPRRGCCTAQACPSLFRSCLFPHPLLRTCPGCSGPALLRRRTRHVLSVLPSLRDSAHGSPLCVSSHLATVLPDDGPHRPPCSLPQPHACSQLPGPPPSPVRQHTARLLFVHSREHLGPPWYRAARTAICHLVVCRSASRHIGPSSPPLPKEIKPHCPQRPGLHPRQTATGTGRQT